MPPHCSAAPATEAPTDRCTATARVTAVIVTYQSRQTVCPTLHAACEAHRAGLLDCIVVDNASTDGTADMIEAEHPWVTVIRNNENIGFGRGCNRGVQMVTTPYVLMLNPDAVLNARSLRTLVEFMQSHPEAGIAAPATLDDEHHPQSAGTLATPSALLQSLIGNHRCAYPHRRAIIPGQAPFRTPWVCGAVMLIRSELFRQLGGFDERFFLYFEETDLCRRAADAGQEIWAVGQAVATHTGSASAKATGNALYTSCIARHYLRSRLKYLTKHYGLARGLGCEALLRLIELGHHLRKALRRQ